MPAPKKFLVLRKNHHNGRLFRKDSIVEETELAEPIPRHFLPLDSRKNPEVAMYEAREDLAKKEAQFRKLGVRYNPNIPEKEQLPHEEEEEAKE